MARLHVTNHEDSQSPELSSTGLPRTANTSRSPRKLLLDCDQAQARQQRSLKLAHVDSLLIPSLVGSWKKVDDRAASANDGGRMRSTRGAMSRREVVHVSEDDGASESRKSPTRSKHEYSIGHEEDGFWNLPRIPRTVQATKGLIGSPPRRLPKGPIEVVDLTSPMKQPSRPLTSSTAGVSYQARERRGSLSSSSGLDDAAMISL